jgi:hypothetical protein
LLLILHKKYVNVADICQYLNYISKKKTESQNRKRQKEKTNKKEEVFKKSCTQFGLNQGHENIFPY